MKIADIKQEAKDFYVAYSHIFEYMRVKVTTYMNWLDSFDTYEEYQKVHRFLFGSGDEIYTKKSLNREILICHEAFKQINPKQPDIDELKKQWKTLMTIAKSHSKVEELRMLIYFARQKWIARPPKKRKGAE